MQYEYLRPIFDWTENSDSYELRLELPGSAEEDIDLKVDGDQLILKAEWSKKNKESGSENRIYHKWHEWKPISGYLERFRLGKGIDRTQIRAQLKNDGVLKITLPKLEEYKARKLTIEV